MSTRSVVVLAGGVGGARFIDGMTRLLAPEEVTVVVNTGDDLVRWGLTICPDHDTCLYTLAEALDPVRGFGRKDESFRVLDEVARLGGERWFGVGDLDLATHLVRTDRLARGERLTTVNLALQARFGLRHRLLPMSDAPRPTRLETEDGILDFQAWFVRERARPRVVRRVPLGPGAATPEVLDALDRASLVVLAPSNPYVSLGPILELDGVQARLDRLPVVAVSPLVGGRAVKGPLVEMLASIDGREASAEAVAACYGGVVDAMLVHPGDACPLPHHDEPLLLTTPADRLRIARAALALGAQVSGGRA